MNRPKPLYVFVILSLYRAQTQNNNNNPFTAAIDRSTEEDVLEKSQTQRNQQCLFADTILNHVCEHEH